MASIVAGKLEKDAEECFARADAAEGHGKSDCAALARARGEKLKELARKLRTQGEISDGRRNPN